ncbi:MAG TPA: hypothetical protein VLJ18_08640 [Thermoanaerobaculia bacterium]|nr:hypothetical protein [Thermoanaerobaculia bacterium]
MTLKSNTSRLAKRAFAGILAGAALLAVPGGPAAGQCTLTAPPASFEPSPPGAARPWQLYAGHNNDVQVYSVGASRRLLMMETFGYSVLDISNPASPYALLYDDLRMDAQPVSAVGDGQSFIASMAVSQDGQRMAFSLNSNANPMLNTVVGAANGQGAAMSGDFLPRNGSSGAVIQHIGNRYIAYVALPWSAISPQPLMAADVTNLPVTLTAHNVPSESAGPGGYYLTLAGNFLVYLTNGTIRVLDASAPGPVGHITTSFPSTTLTGADFGGGTLSSVTAAVDPVDSAKVWILAELTVSGQPAPRWALLSLKSGVKTLNGAPYQIVAGGGETWPTTGVAALIPSGGSLVALMWGKRSSPTVVYRLFSSSVAGWGTTNSTDVTPAQSPSFSLYSAMRGFAGSGNSVYAYLATANSAFALSLSCVTVPMPPVDSLAVQIATCPSPGACPVNPGDAVFVGTQLLVTPTAFSLHPLTDWRLDFDWHPPAEDNGSPPRLKSPDLSYPASGATPPATIALFGPCDPRSGGAPATGAGCWASETANGDFPAIAPAGTTASLSLALEATNDLGPGNTVSFPITWKVPAVRLQSPNILLGQSLQSASDGTPLSTGYKWYFGTTPSSLTLSSCTTASCTPPPPFDAKGTYYYWLTVPYPTGYTSPDCGSPCTQNLGTFSITDVSLSFSGVASTVVAGGSVTATDGSDVAGSVTSCGGGLQYSLCDASAGPCAAGSWQSLSLSSPLGSGGAGLIPAGSLARTWWLRIRYSYTTTGSCASPFTASWVPSVSGVSDPTAWPIVVTPAPPYIFVQVNGANPCAGPGGGCIGGIPANVGDPVTIYAIINGGIDQNPPPATLWDFGPSASPATCAGTGCQASTFHFTAPGTFTITLSGYAIPTSLTFVVAAPPVVASNGGSVCAGSPLALFATPSISGAAFSWTGPNGFTSTLQNPVIGTATTAATGTYTVVRTFAGQTSTSTTSGVVRASPAVPVAGGNSPLCAGGTLSLTAATVAGATYAWTGPNGFTSTLQNPALAGATAAASGTYVVTATVNGCSTAASIGVTVNTPPPAPTAANGGPICAGGTLTLTASTIANATYAWTGPNGFTSAQQSPSISNASGAAAGAYSVTATVNGCTGPAASTTAVVNAVSAAIAAPTRICLASGNTGTASVPDAGGGATYAWTITNGAISGGQGTSSISFSVAGEGTTTLGVTVASGLCSASGSAAIPVQTLCGGLSAVTPCRAVDTRNAAGPFGAPPLQANGVRLFNLVSVCGVPSTAKALSANLTVVRPAASGALHVYPGDLGTAPTATAISFAPGKTRANNAVLRLATDGSGTVAVLCASGGIADLIIDVNGYFE